MCRRGRPFSRHPLINRRVERQEARRRRRVYRREYLRRSDAGDAVFCASRDNVSYERHLRYGLAGTISRPSQSSVSERIEVMPGVSFTRSRADGRAEEVADEGYHRRGGEQFPSAAGNRDRANRRIEKGLEGERRGALTEGEPASRRRRGAIWRRRRTPRADTRALARATTRDERSMAARAETKFPALSLLAGDSAWAGRGDDRRRHRSGRGEERTSTLCHAFPRIGLPFARHKRRSRTLKIIAG